MELTLKCDVCGLSHWAKYGRQLAQCRICGLIRAQVNPSDDELKEIYQKQYFFGDEYIDYVQDRQALETNFRNRIQYLKKYYTAETNVIEVGCAYGFFLSTLKPFVKRCLGYDITKEGVEYAKNKLQVEAYCDSFLNYTGPQVDVICMWDVIEHLSKPDEFIGKISSSLKKSGYIALTTGDIGATLAKWQKDNWRLIHPPTHLFYFDRNSMTKLLLKHGFEIVSYRYQPIYRNVGSVLNQLALGKKKQSNLLRAASAVIHLLRLNNINFGLNLFDIMEVVAQKVR